MEDNRPVLCEHMGVDGERYVCHNANEHNLFCVEEVRRIRKAYPEYGTMPAAQAMRIRGLLADHSG